MEITSYKLDFGAQYTQQFGKKHAATLGVVFSRDIIWEMMRMYKPSWAVRTLDILQRRGHYTDNGYSYDAGRRCDVCVYDDRLTVGADVMFQKWNSVTFMNDPDAFCNKVKVALGAEYILT